MTPKTKLQKIREDKGFSVLRLSELSGVSYATVRKLDRGVRVEATQYQILEKVALAVGLNPWDVFPHVKRDMKRRMDQMKMKPSPEEYVSREDVAANDVITMKSLMEDEDAARVNDDFFKRIFMKIDPLEKGELIRSGLDVEDPEFEKAVREFSGKYKIDVPEDWITNK